MSRIKHFWLLEAPEKLVNWFVSPRNFGLKLVSLGLLFLGFPSAINWAVDFAGNADNSVLKVHISSSDIPNWLTTASYLLGGLLVIFGLIIAIRHNFQDRQLASRRRVLAVEFRGMIDTTDSPLVHAVKGAALTQREEILFDVREHVKRGIASEIELALSKISRLPERLKEKSLGRDRADITVFAGALMPVPLQFYAGFLFDDETSLTLMDWQRNERKWSALDEIDDFERFMPCALPEPGSSQVVLAVSISYEVDYEAIEKCFPNMPIVRLTQKKPTVNSLWSEEKQQALGQQFLIIVGQLANLGVKRIHLILAAPSSLCMRLGSLYDHRNFPELIVYQYEKANSKAYPWGVLMPTHGIGKHNVITT